MRSVSVTSPVAPIRTATLALRLRVQDTSCILNHAMNTDCNNSTGPTRQPIRSRAVLWLERAKMREGLFTLGVAICIGILCGFGAVGFRYLIDLFHRLFWGEWELKLVFLQAAPPWKVIAIPALGGLIVGPIVYFLPGKHGATAYPK